MLHLWRNRWCNPWCNQPPAAPLSGMLSEWPAPGKQAHRCWGSQHEQDVPVSAAGRHPREADVQGEGAQVRSVSPSRCFRGRTLPVLVDSFASSGALTSARVVHYPALRRWADIWDGRPAYTQLQDAVSRGETLTVQLSGVRDVTAAGREQLLDVRRCAEPEPCPGRRACRAALCHGLAGSSARRVRPHA